VRVCLDEPAEAAAVAKRCAELIATGTPAREIAVLFRTNAQSESHEEALAEAGVPYVVHGAERFFDRAEIRQAMVALRAATRSIPEATPLPEAVDRALESIGWRGDAPPPGGAARERWEALAALAGLADEIGGTLAGFAEELGRRAAAQHAPTVDGVTLASLHAAKGLEWDAVFVVGLAEGTLPTTYARTPEALEEERRLLYVGITRARQWLWLSYAEARSPGGRPRRPSRFLPLGQERPERAGQAAGGRAGRKVREEARRRTLVASCRVCGATLLAGPERKLGRCADCPSNLDEELHDRLREWRLRVSGAAGVPAYVVFTDATLTALAERRPDRPEELIQIAGIGPRKLGLYGEAVLALIAGAKVDDLVQRNSLETRHNSFAPPQAPGLACIHSRAAAIRAPAKRDREQKGGEPR
jgi:DNA helicase-2/ATP-dependent DNA helicase PcrA